MNDLIMNVDSLSGIMEFSKVKERRNLSCVSSLFKETFDKSREECTRVVMRKLVEERQGKMYFPIVTSIEDPLTKGLPKIFNKMSMRRYFDYQIDQAYTRYYRYGMNPATFREAVEKDDETCKIFCKAAVLFFHGCGSTSSDATIRNYIDDFTGNEESIDMVESGIDDRLDISQLFPVLYNEFGNNALDTFIKQSWRERIGYLPLG